MEGGLPPIGVTVVTDIHLYGEGLAQVLAGDTRLRVFGAIEPQLAVARISATQPDVVLIDSSHGSALGIVRAIAVASPSTKVIVFAVGDSDAELLSCIEAGVAGYVPRTGTTRDLRAAIEHAVRDEAVCSPQTVASLFRRLANLARAREHGDVDARLSAREREIVALIDRGWSNKAIAMHLRIGLATVKNHVHNILEKLRVSRRGEIAARIRGDAMPPASFELPRALREPADRKI